MLGLMKSNVCVPLLNIPVHTSMKVYSKAIIYISELILTSFSLFDIKCKKLKPLNANTIKWSNTLRQFTGWLLESSCQELLEMISYCIIFETNIFIEIVICVAIDFKGDTRQKKL